MTSTPPPAPRLLGRAEFAQDLAEAAEIVRGRRVLVTGAAGSIGSPLSRLLARAAPRSLVLLDHHEHSLFSLERALRGAPEGVSFELADVRDQRRLERVFERYTPEVVVHLAAAKHVPYGERFPEGAVATNVLSTHALLKLAERVNCELFVYPSSDKSVQPPSVYGATKRLAEALVQRLAGERRWAVVRYVNIIGTRGSVIETFTQQILADAPLSITDERMTRYWISMDEALWTLLLSTRCAGAGQVVMPECGAAVPILETARQLAGWYRPDEVPYPIVCTGIRPGERLHEVLLSPNESLSAEQIAPGVRGVKTSRPATALANVDDVVDALERLVSDGDRDALARTCLQAAMALQ